MTAERYETMLEEYEARKREGVKLEFIGFMLPIIRDDFLKHIDRPGAPTDLGEVLRAVEYCMVIFSGIGIAGEERNSPYDLGKLRNIEIKKAECPKTPAQMQYERKRAVTPLAAWVALGVAAKYYREKIEANDESCTVAIAYLLTIEGCMTLLQSLLQIEMPHEAGYWDRYLDELLELRCNMRSGGR